MQYDATLKELFQGAPVRLLEILTGRRPREVLAVEFPAVRVRRPDLLTWMSNSVTGNGDSTRDVAVSL